METLFNIGEIAHFFHLPASTLRYWEDIGVITPQKNFENNYREYTLSDFMTISDVLFYKNLGFPLKQIREMEQTTPIEYQQLLEGKINDLEIQKLEIEHRIQKLHTHLAAINTLKELKNHPFSPADIDADYIIPFELDEIDKLQQYIQNPYLYSRVQHSSDLEKEQRGLTVTANQLNSFSNNQKLWKKGNHKYVVCLMKEEVSDNFPNNLRELLKHVQKTYQTGYIISRFLLRSQENEKLYDFYKTYIEIIK